MGIGYGALGTCTERSRSIGHGHKGKTYCNFLSTSSSSSSLQFL
ncbi:hypothetical protein [Nostoc sp. CHAB 5715]|nr:hypothetical protein [Nostoc sp. CHAB 5715]